MQQQQRWDQLEATAATLPTDDLTRLLDGLCLTTEYAQALAKYQQARQSELCRLTAGVHATFIAWQIRGGAYAKYLGEGQAEGFLQHLNQAYEHLNYAFTTPAYQAEAAARTVRVAMGLSEPEVAREAFAHCTSLVPEHLQGHLFYFNILTPKWFGSEEELEDFVDRAPTPALHQLLQAMYLVELYNEVADSSEIVKQKFRHDNARRIQALTSLPPLAAQTLYAIYRNNYLAGLHHALGNAAARNEFLRQLGPASTYYPWMYFGLDWLAVQKLAASPN